MSSSEDGGGAAWHGGVVVEEGARGVVRGDARAQRRRGASPLSHRAGVFLTRSGLRLGRLEVVDEAEARLEQCGLRRLRRVGTIVEQREGSVDTRVVREP